MGKYPILASCTAVLFLAPAVIGQNTLQGNDCTAAGAYTLCQNLWGANTGVGSQTTTLISADGDSVSWSTSYQWSQSPDNVKSYPNVYHNTAKGMQLQDITSAPTSWQWYYKSASSDLRADVSYDLWTGVPKSGDPASGASSYEIMIWLSQRGGVGGIGNVVAQNLRVGGHTWTLKHGPNSNWDVFSFITAEGDITDFRADLADFFQYLIDQQGVAKTQYLQAIQIGTEPFTGSAELVITNFSVDVSTTSDKPPPPPSSPSPSPSPSSSQAPTSASRTSAAPAGTSPAGNGTNVSATGSQTGSADPSGTLVPAPAQSSFIPIQVGVRKAGGPQCVLRGPGGTAPGLAKRR
ncbi:concanavalin A-like lectin/glucanase domain-containing protein [Trametes polyzona]|nr:concanavalin A-like lectin/glucanase domain-containing protein [Trametes polyzona]